MWPVGRGVRALSSATEIVFLSLADVLYRHDTLITKASMDSIEMCSMHRINVAVFFPFPEHTVYPTRHVLHRAYSREPRFRREPRNKTSKYRITAAQRESNHTVMFPAITRSSTFHCNYQTADVSANINFSGDLVAERVRNGVSLWREAAAIAYRSDIVGSPRNRKKEMFRFTTNKLVLTR